jgi:hypothetical protein
VYVPALSYIATLLQIAAGGPQERVLVEPNPLAQPTEKEQAETNKLKAETAAILIDRAVISADDVNDRLEVEMRERGEPLDDEEVELFEDAFILDGEGHTPPQGVRAAATRGLELRKKFGRGGTAVGVARARDLARGAQVSDQTIMRMSSFFARHGGQLNRSRDAGWGNTSKPSAQWIAWLLWGGDPGKRWADKVKASLAREDAGLEEE